MLNLNQINLQHELLLIEESEPVSHKPSGGIVKTADTIAAEIAKQSLYVGLIVKVADSNKVESLKVGQHITYHKQAADKFDLPVEGYKNLRTMKGDYVIAIIEEESHEESSN